MKTLILLLTSITFLTISLAPRTPHFDRQDPDYLMEQLRHYRFGSRPHEVMAVIAKSISEKDLEAVVSWYGSLRIPI